MAQRGRPSKPVVKQSSSLVDEQKVKYRCCMCGKEYTRQKGNFPASQSSLYVGNNSYLPICRSCIDKLYIHYCEVLGDEEEAIRRVAMKWDIYYHPKLAASSKKISADRSRIGAFVSRANLTQYNGRTYDTTIDEEAEVIIDTFEDAKELPDKVKQRTVKLFGLGYSPDELQFLQIQYEDWIARHECKSKAQEEVFKNLCISQLNVNRATQSGDPKKIESAMNTFNSMLGTANLKPSQTNQNALTDQNSFGTLIKKWEDEKPIPEPDEEFRDVDNIKHYISVWFLGHLCKMVGIKNSYSKAYEEETAKYNVEQPEYFEDDEDSDLEDLLGGALDGN